MISIKAVKSALREYRRVRSQELAIKKTLKLLGNGYSWHPETLTFYNERTGDRVFFVNG